MSTLIDERQQPYRLSGGSGDAVALTNEVIEDRVETRWFSCLIDRKLLKQLMRRSDAEGLKNFGPWLVLLIASGYAGFLAWGTWWALPAFFLYGTLYSSSDARWHECGHGTPFRTRWLNEVFYHLSSFMTLREAYLWRWSHSRHHTHTIIVGRDPEIQVTRPADLAKIALDFFYVFGGTGELKKIFMHALGIVGSDVKDFMPESERSKMIWSSRVYVAIIGGTAIGSIAIGSFLPMMYVALPRFYCGWHHQLCGLTQHAGLAENVRDHRLNTRTIYLNSIYRFLYLNMNYHIEHHMFPMVPFHALPKLHAAIKDQLPRTYAGIIDAYREIIPALFRQARDPGYFVCRELPASAAAQA
ncbi:MAG: fatty acid desaturase family protein [Methylobacteriaceae bacterium]|nr:fatty acid desaturase family protein [Methylobacteriaceae bacterium]MBV9244723.1 fatty acid desaturase family protein [Methylobacteriaceae bacterium]